MPYVRYNPTPAGIGGLIHVDSGVWLCNFLGKLGDCIALESELWAIHVGLEEAWRKDIPRIVVETNSKLAIKHIHKDTLGGSDPRRRL
ncbi:hypothetical protein L1049_005787 [Liquidambar formosana]|uniref:RNase H type-1 domain-containing protein n=1 Tax=Liquidambar formosana TaxID=63359 RepID=A0AAP0RGG8_LIQFO